MARGGLSNTAKRQREEVAFINTEHPGRPFGPYDGGAKRTSLFMLVGFVGLTLLVGAANQALTLSNLHGWYLSLSRPPGTPPNWLFGPVWTTLDTLMALAAWRVWRCNLPPGREHRRRPALRLWGWQLLVNAAWTPAFFGLHSPLLGCVVIAALLVLITATMRAFRLVSHAAALLMLPYLAWTCYAGYLNAGFLWLNPHG